MNIKSKKTEAWRFNSMTQLPPSRAGTETFYYSSILSCLEAQFSSVQSLSRVFATPWTTTRQASLSITNSRSSPKSMSIESVIPSNHLILCRPLLPSALNLSQHQGLFKCVSSSHQWPDYDNLDNLSWWLGNWRVCWQAGERGRRKLT